MTLKAYLTIMSLATGVCWLSFVYVVRTINPDLTNWLGFLMFYSSLFLALTGSFAIFGFFIRFVVFGKALIFRVVKAAFRQSFLIAFALIACLLLLAYNLFTWLNLFFLIAFLSILEFCLLSLDRPLNRR